MVWPLTCQPLDRNTAGYSGGKKYAESQMHLSALIADAFAPRPVQSAGVVIFTIFGLYVCPVEPGPAHTVAGVALGLVAHAALWAWSHVSATWTSGSAR